MANLTPRPRSIPLAFLLAAFLAACSSSYNGLREGSYEEALREAKSTDAGDMTSQQRGVKPLGAVAQNQGLTDAERAEILGVLLKRGALVDAIDAMGTTALVWAARSDSVEAARVLLEAGANPDMPDRDGWGPMRVAIDHGNEAMIAALRAGGASINVRTNKNESPYFAPALAGDVDALDRLNALGVPHNVRGRSGLEGAALGGHADVVRHLVESCGARASLANSFGETAATLAAEAGDLEILRYLAQHGCPVDTGRRTPLMAAAAGGHLEVVEWLVGRGARIEERAGGLPSPLVHAAVREHGDVTTALLRAGASIPTRITDDATLNAAGHATIAASLDVLGRHTEAAKQHLLAKASYLDAADELDAAAEHYADKASTQRLMSFLLPVLQGVASVGQQKVAANQAKQMASISAMQHAESTGTGLAGYHAAYDPALVESRALADASSVSLPMASMELTLSELAARGASYDDLADSVRELAADMRARAAEHATAAADR